MNGNDVLVVFGGTNDYDNTELNPNLIFNFNVFLVNIRYRSLT